MSDVDTRVDEYLRRVRAALSDLPADEVAEIMEDLEPHVAEVYAETRSVDEVVARLGTPEEYAAELRLAGGYQAAAEPAQDRPRLWRARYVVWSAAVTTASVGLAGMLAVGRYDRDEVVAAGFGALVALPALWLVFAGIVRRSDVEALPEYRGGRALGLRLLASVPWVERARDLRGAWWLARLVVLALAFLGALGADGGYWMLVVLAAAGALLWAGPRVVTDRRLLLVVVPANALAIGLGLGLAAQAVTLPPRGDVYFPTSGMPGLSYNGHQLENVYAVDGEGKPIPEFYLYDSEGNPLNVHQYGCGEYDVERYGNRFPAPESVYGPHGCVETRDMPFVPLPPSAVTPPTTTTTGPTTTSPTTTSPTTAKTGPSR